MPKHRWDLPRAGPKFSCQMRRASASNFSDKSGSRRARIERMRRRSSAISEPCHCSPMMRLNKLKTRSMPAVEPGHTKKRSKTGRNAFEDQRWRVLWSLWVLAKA